VDRSVNRLKVNVLSRMVTPGHFGRSASDASTLLMTAMVIAACAGSPAATPETLADGSTRHWARSEPSGIGSSAALVLYTHCGFEQAVIDFASRLWGPVVPQVGVGNQAARTYANPIDEGTITLVGPNHAAYLSATGHTIQLRPLGGPLVVAPCY